jgi:hypothetical protein
MMKGIVQQKMKEVATGKYERQGEKKDTLMTWMKEHWKNN